MKRAIEDLLELLRIPGVSTEEAGVAEHLVKTLRSLGVPQEAISRDRVHERSEYGGQCGNLIVRFPAVGDDESPARLFSAHMDTVAIAKGAKPRVAASKDGGEDAGRIVNDAPGTALGADNRTGCAVLLQVARALMEADPSKPRPPAALVFFVQEELGLIGSREFDIEALGFDRPAVGFNFDGSRPDEIVTKVTGTSRFHIEIEGVASHAGSDPASGVSAAVVAGKAIAALAEQGWHGRIERKEGRGSANIGTMHGGAGTNVVMDHLAILAEARSHDPAFRKRIIRTYEEAFQRAAAETVNRQGRSAAVSFRPGPCYESFALADDAPVVQMAWSAVRNASLDPRLVSNDGGMDANWLNAHGIPTVTFGAGARDVHTPDEWIDLNDFCAACRLALGLL